MSLKFLSVNVDYIVFDEDVSFYSCRTLRLTNVETEQCLHVFENGQNQVLSVLVRSWVVLKHA